MKTHSNNLIRIVTNSCITAVMAGVLAQAHAATEPEGKAADPRYQHYKGTVVEVDRENRLFTGKKFWSWAKPTFHVGEDCLVLLQDSPEASFQDVRPGQRVHVRYRTMEGVKVASQITENNPSFSGHITRIHPDRRTMTVKKGLFKKDFVVDSECVVVQGRDNPWTFSDLKLGHPVTVTYLNAGSTNVAAKIRQAHEAFRGTLEAMDADARVIRAQHLLSERKFTLSDDCPILIGDRTDGSMKELQLGDTLLVHYETIDGVMVAHRIERKPRPMAETNSSEQARQEIPNVP